MSVVSVMTYDVCLSFANTDYAILTFLHVTFGHDLLKEASIDNIKAELLISLNVNGITANLVFSIL